MLHPFIYAATEHMPPNRSSDADTGGGGGGTEPSTGETLS
jgi:hypothetical protein